MRVAAGQQRPLTLAARSALFPAILLIEAVALSARFDAISLFHSFGATLAPQVAGLSLWAIHFLIGFAGIFVTFRYLREGSFAGISFPVASQPVRLGLLSGHAACFAVFLCCSFLLSQPGSSATLVVPLLFAGIAAFLFAACAFAPLSAWLSALNATGSLALYSAAGALVAASAVAQSWRLWTPVSRVTFQLVALLLRPFIPNLVVNPTKLIIGSATFQAFVASSCSGLEGAALLLVFLALWLFLFRTEIRLPQALLVIPVGLAALFLLNAVRIAALVLIGHAGRPDIAAQGFHSQAGWIAFNSVAFGICLVAQRLPWLFSHPATVSAQGQAAVPNAVAAYLMPFLAILAAGMLARALSGQFEWFYGLRLLAVSGVLWHFRNQYAALLFKPDWRGIIPGFAVFVFWISISHFLNSSNLKNQVPVQIAAAPLLAQAAWIGVRVLTATLLVPFAEELAFRGYFLRRFTHQDFEHVLPGKSSMVAMLASSVIFGVLHGDRWVAGTVAGLVYAAVYRSRGNLTSAILAHATTNALLAGFVLFTGQWGYW